MLNAVIRLALRYRTLVLAISLIVLVYGGYLATRFRSTSFPTSIDRASSS